MNPSLSPYLWVKYQEANWDVMHLEGLLQILNLGQGNGISHIHLLQICCSNSQIVKQKDLWKTIVTYVLKRHTNKSHSMIIN